MLLGYARVSKSDGSQNLDLQQDALKAYGVEEENIYSDYASGKLDDRPHLQACLKALRKEDTLIVWKLDRLGRNLHHLINIVHDLQNRGIGFKVLTGQGADIDTNTANGRLIFSIFASLAEYERELISERTKAGLASARARGRKGGRKFKMTPIKLQIAQVAMEKSETKISDLCKELGITRQTLYRYLDPKGELRSGTHKLMVQKNNWKSSSENDKFHREIIVENIKAGLKSARKNARVGGRPKLMSDNKIRTAKAMLKDNKNYPFISDIIKTISIGRTTFYRYFPPESIQQLRPQQ